MCIDPGTNKYNLGKHPVTGTGLEYTKDELNSAVKIVSDVVYDVTGTDKAKSITRGTAETDFEKDGIERIFSETQPVDWRVGEALAETYLDHHQDCFFPWPDKRDVRKSGSSLPGADLYGFHEDYKGTYFAFGEVKTSSESKYPPRVITVNDGLKNQIENLKQKIADRDALVRYLAYHAIGADWENKYKEASTNYLKSDTNVRIFGFLVRDVEPKPKDLQKLVNDLAIDPPEDMVMKIFALYLPSGSIKNLGLLVNNYRNKSVV